MLCRLARECESCLRISDVFCRYGGDEFVIIAPETTALAAMALARRMRQNIDAVSTDQSFGALAISIGIAVWEDNFKSNDDFIAALTALSIKPRAPVVIANASIRPRAC
jgi:diguanylate cyclase (GGDEF)-like protein